MGFLEKLKAMLMGGGQPPPQAAPQGNPWDDPSLAGDLGRPTPAAPSPMPPAPPMNPMEDAIQQAMKLQKQREIAKSLLPEGTWNR